MKIYNKILLLTFVVYTMTSCVPAKKYYEIADSNTKYLKQLSSDSTRISSLVDVNGKQLMQILALSEDSMRLHYSYDSLEVLYKKNSQYGSIQLANIKRELDNKDLEVNHSVQKSQSIISTLTSYDVEANTIYRQLDRYFQQYRNSGTETNKSYWNVVISLPDDLIFANNEHTSLSPTGKKIISAIVTLVKNHPKYNIDITEFSRPEKKTYFKDTVVTYTVTDTLYQKIGKPDSLNVYDEIAVQYSYEGFRVDKTQVHYKTPASMNKGTAIIEYIESLGTRAKGVTYNGAVYTYLPKQLHEPRFKTNMTEIIINPKISSILRDIGSF